MNIPTRDQCACHLYLPRNIAAEVAFLAMLDREPGLDHTLWMNILAEARRLGWLAEAPFAKQVCCGSISSLLEEWLSGYVTSRYIWVENSLLASRNGGYYYEDVMRDLAQLTAGEWNLQHLRCTDDEERPGISIAFDFRNKHFTWLLAPPARRYDTMHNHLLSIKLLCVMPSQLASVFRR